VVELPNTPQTIRPVSRWRVGMPTVCEFTARRPWS
jgi:hypothetical protein